MDDVLRVVGLLGELAGRESQFSATVPLLQWRNRYCFPSDLIWSASELQCLDPLPPCVQLPEALRGTLSTFALGDILWLIGRDFATAALRSGVQLPPGRQGNLGMLSGFQLWFGDFEAFKAASRRMYHEAKNRYIETQFVNHQKVIADCAFQVMNSLVHVDQEDQVLMRGVHYFLRRNLGAYRLVGELALIEELVTSMETFHGMVRQAIDWYALARVDDDHPARAAVDLSPEDEAIARMFERDIFETDGLEHFIRGIAETIDESRASFPADDPPGAGGVVNGRGGH